MPPGYLIRTIGLFVCLFWSMMGCSLTPPDAGDANCVERLTPSPPQADARAGQWVLDNEAYTVALDGSGSSCAEGLPLTYRWYCSDEEASFSPANDSPTPTVSFPGPGIYVFMLVVNDGIQPSEPDFITVTVGTPPPPDLTPPVANAGSDQTVQVSEADAVPLDGTESSDAETSSLAYSWYSSNEEASFLPDNLSPAPTVSLPGPGIYIIMLVVNDGTQPSEPDFVTITVEAPPSPEPIPPVAIAGSDQTVLVTEAETVTLDGTQSYDPEASPLTYQWHCSNEEVIYTTRSNTARPEVSLPGPGSYLFVLVVHDGLLSSNPDFLTVTVEEPDAWVDSELIQDIPSQQMYRTIQAAIDAVADGTDKLIAVDHGTYEEQVRVANRVRLYGMLQAGDERPKIEYTAPENEAVVILGTDTVLENFHIVCKMVEGRDDDHSLKSAITVAGTGAEIANCRCNDSYSDGISLDPQSTLEVRDTVLNGLRGEGMVAGSGTTLQVFDSSIKNTAGSNVWAVGADFLQLENSVLYKSNWHGVDAQNCDHILVDHCTIVDFSIEGGQAGLMIADGTEVSITNSLIVKNQEVDEPLYGIHVSTSREGASHDVLHNYLFFSQNQTQYFSGELTLGSIHESNLPNAAQPHSQDPLLMNPEEGDFRLDIGSPAAGWGENGEDCGALGNVLVQDLVSSESN